MIHELMHAPQTIVENNLLLNLNFHVYTPFTLGFGEYRKLHLEHHCNSNSINDPDFWLIKDGKLNAFLRVGFAPEYWFLYSIKKGYFNRKSVLFYVLRMFLLSLYIYTVGFEAFVILYLIPTKIAYALTFMTFSYETHIDDTGTPNGSWNLQPHLKLINQIIKVLIGKQAYNIAYYHATHHKYPLIAGKQLNYVNNEVISQQFRLPERHIIF